jgi:hypothetical protein
MFQDFLGSVLVRGKFRGTCYALGKQAKRSEFFSNFPHVLLKNVEHWNKTFFCFAIKGLQGFFCSTRLEQIPLHRGTLNSGLDALARSRTNNWFQLAQKKG